MLIVDAHVHTFQSKEVSKKVVGAFNAVYSIEFKNPGDGDIDEVLCNMKENNIRYTVMVNFAPAKILHENNIWSLKQGMLHPELLPCVSFHPDMEGDLLPYLLDYVEKGCKGIKIHPMAQDFHPNHEKLQEIYGYCNENNLPVVFHCGRVSNARLNHYSDLNNFLPIIEKYNQMPVVLTHMVDGNMEDVRYCSKKYKNVYFDTSIIITGYPSLMKVNEPSWLEDDEVVSLIKEIGSESIIFGSDYPWGSPKHDIQRIQNLSISDDEKKKILGMNAVQLFKVVN